MNWMPCDIPALNTRKVSFQYLSDTPTAIAVAPKLQNGWEINGEVIHIPFSQSGSKAQLARYHFMGKHEAIIQERKYVQVATTVQQPLRFAWNKRPIQKTLISLLTPVRQQKEACSAPGLRTVPYAHWAYHGQMPLKEQLLLGIPKANTYTHTHSMRQTRLQCMVQQAYRD